MTYGMTRRTVVSAMALAATTGCITPAFAQSVENFYRGKTVTLLVSADAGTPTDLIARQFANIFAKHIPGHPKAIVMNSAGAGGMVAALSLQSRQPSDGTVVGFLQRNNLYVPLLEQKKNGFDPRNVTWIGSLDKVHYCLVAMSRAGLASGVDLMSKRLTIGATGFSNENRTLPALLNEYVGTKMNIVPGYSGRGEVYLAMQRGEIDGWAPTLDGLREGEPAKMIADGRMKVLLHMDWKSAPEFPNVPNLSQFVTKPEIKALFDFFLLPFQAGRPIAVPKNVPQDRVDALSAAFAKTVADPEFASMMKSQGFPIDPIDGKEIEQIVAKIYATPPEALSLARKTKQL